MKLKVDGVRIRSAEKSGGQWYVETRHGAGSGASLEEAAESAAAHHRHQVVKHDLDDSEDEW